MERKPTLSPSKITTYLACPVKYRWSYVDSRGKWFVRAKAYYSFGASLHAVLQRFHDQGDMGVQTTEHAVAALEESWISAGYSSPEEAAEALAEGRELVASYVDEHLARASDTKTLFVEQSLRLDMGEFILVGRLDRVDEREDGTLEIIDYKSGRLYTTEEELRNDIELNCYQLLLRARFPNRRVLSTILSLKSQSSTTIEPSEQDLAEFREALVTLGREIIHRDYESVLPTVKDLCPACDFLPLCSRDEDFADEYEDKFAASHAD